MNHIQFEGISLKVFHLMLKTACVKDWLFLDNRWNLFHMSYIHGDDCWNQCYKLD